MIESKNDTSKNLEKASHLLKQAQQRVANEKKNRMKKTQSRGNVFTLFTGCAQIYHQRWHVRSPRGKFHLHGLLPRALSVFGQAKGEKVSKLPYAIPLRKHSLLPFNELYRQNVGVAYG